MNALVTTVPAGPLTVPDFLKTVKGGEGLGNIDKDDLILPRLALCQSSNDERKRSHKKFIEGLEDGDFFNSLTRQNYGNTITVVAINYSKTRIYFKPPVGSGVMLCRSMNSINGGKLHPESCDTCEHSKYVGDNPPVCTKFANFAVLLLANPSPELLMMSFKSTGLSAAKQWTSRLNSTKVPQDKGQEEKIAPAYSSYYEIKSQEQTKPKGTFYGPVITRKDWVSADLFHLAEREYHAIKDITLAIVEDDAGDHDEEAEPEGRDIPF
jgi:hypothetical protein